MDTKYIRQFKKGSLEMVLLCIIGSGETYGYEIITRLNSKGAMGLAREGTVYPILYRLQKAGLVASRLCPSTANGGEKKYYSLTDAGREALDELILFWGEYAEWVNGFIKSYKRMEETA